jgi:hypothetical protein
VLRGYLAIEPVTIPPTCPFFSHSGGELRPISKMSVMKRNTTKLGGEGSFGSHEMNLLVLVVQLVVPSEDICSRPTPAGSNDPDNFDDLNDCVRHKLMQLYLEFT